MIGFSVQQRDTFHWDFNINGNRVFRIRGEYPRFIVYDERDFSIRCAELRFETVSEAFKYICDVLTRTNP